MTYLKSRLARLEAKHGDGNSPLIFCLHQWADGCASAFQPWEQDQIPQYKAMALDNLVARGEIRESDRGRVVLMTRVLVD